MATPKFRWNSPTTSPLGKPVSGRSVLDTNVGEGSAEIITSKELLVRLQAPRFLVERDEAVLSAVVHNDHDAPKTVKISLELDGNHLEAIDGSAKTVEIAARSEARVDWRVKALREGEATLRMKADAGDDGDAVERKLPVLVHGMSRQDAWSRVVEPDQESARILMEVPEQRRPDQSKLTVRFSPTIAGAVVDAIPYLASYPYGCTEQTLNRFVPAVIAQRMLKDLKINLAEVKAKRTNLNPQELGNAADRAAQWKQWQNNPVFDEAEMEKMVAAGVDKLMSMQNSDGGWGWFSGYGEVSYPHTTAVVVHGLLVAKANGATIPRAHAQLRHRLADGLRAETGRRAPTPCRTRGHPQGRKKDQGRQPLRKIRMRRHRRLRPHDPRRGQGAIRNRCSPSSTATASRSRSMPNACSASNTTARATRHAATK